jgi:hypothetical protein
MDEQEQIMQHLEAKFSRREKSDERTLVRYNRKAEQAEALVGELVREGKVVYYINVRGRDGNFTGKTAEFAFHFDAVDYLIRNHYV